MSTLRYLLSLMLLCTWLCVCAASPYEDYIDRYAPLAVRHQAEHGIPASITLAQGLLESAAGRSALAVNANNHFGIKCHKDWTGGTVSRDDDAPGECFRAYDTPEESYEDHARFLKRSRYRSLFDLQVTDYKGWAKGLRACGYATDPQYAARLVTVIERYALYAYDTGEAVDEAGAAFIRDMLQRSHTVRRSRGLHFVVAVPGDTYGSLAQEFGIATARLLECNDCGADREVRDWQEVYLEPKHDTAPEGMKTITIGDGEDLHSVSQRLGIKLSALRDMNPRAKDRPGTRLKLTRRH